MGRPLTIHYAGRTTSTRISPQQTVLEAALSVLPDLPNSCRTGVCGTCRTVLVRGSVATGSDHALTESEQRRGFILACQSHPAETGHPAAAPHPPYAAQAAAIEVDFDAL